MALKSPLQVILNNTGLQQTDQRLFQFLNSLIIAITQINNNITNISGGGGSAGPKGDKGDPGVPGFVFGRGSGGSGSGMIVPGQTGPPGSNGATGAAGPMGPAVHFANKYYESRIFQQILNVSAGGATANIAEASLTVTNTQMQSLNTTPLTIVAAPGVGKLLMPLVAAWHKDTTAGTASNNPALSIRFAGVALDATSQAAIVPTAADNRYGLLPTQTSFANTTSDLSNRDLVVFFNANLTGGNANNRLYINLVYYTYQVAP